MAVPQFVDVEEDVSNQRYHVLLVDDDPGYLHLLIKYLSPEYHLTTATNGFAALEQLEQKPDIDLVILDIMMPGITGYEVCRRIRQHFLRKDLPILFLTAKNATKALIGGFSAGASDYLNKPFRKAELLARLEAHLQLREESLEQIKALELLQRKIAQHSTDQVAESQREHLLQELLVQVMNLALRYWEQSTQKTRFDLAEESGIWTVSINQGGSYQTRTLDRYLHLNTLPQKPRWHDVLRTAYYVLQHCEAIPHLKEELENMVNHLTLLIHQHNLH